MSKMKRGRWLTAGIMTAVLAAFVPALVSGQAAQYTAQLIGANEMPSTTSTATGTFTATLDETAQTLTWGLAVPSITDAVAAHIHAGGAGVNGGIVFTLFTPSSPAGSMNVSGVARPGDLSGSLAGDWAGFVAALKSGGLYVNVHTTTNPGGDIRGQVTSVSQGTPTATATATGIATSTATATPARTGTPAAISTATPSAPTTGQAGLVDDSDNSGAAILLVVLAVAVVAGGRLLTSRRR